MKCPRCNFENLPEARFCGMCGARLTVSCTSCGQLNPLDYRFCMHCGTVLNGELPLPVIEPQPVIVNENAVQPILPRPVQTGELRGQRRIATVILADVKNSTDLMEKIGSEAWVTMMNRVFHVLETEIYRFGGQVGQFRGDGLVAFFGAKAADEDDPEHAVMAALSMQRAIRAYAANLVETEDIQIALRVGVNTGEVIIASVGDRKQYSEEDTAMGEAVALAARMETAAEPGTVLVSDNTYQLVKNRFTWEVLGEIRVKGISHPVAVYRPLEPVLDEQVSEVRAGYALTAPLTGRGAEYKTVINAVHNLYDGRGGVVLISGEKGLGKSYLVNQVHQHFVRHGMMLHYIPNLDLLHVDREEHSPEGKPLVWLRGRCRSYDQQWPFSMWRDLILSWLELTPDTEGQDVANRLKTLVADLWGVEQEKVYPYLASFMALPLDENDLEKIRHLTAEALQNQYYLTIKNWVEMLSRRGPLVLAFGDLHWADTSSIHLLEFCMDVCESEPLLWMMVFRPDRTSPAWQLRHYVETEFPHRLTDLNLQPLSDRQSLELIEQLVGCDGPSEETRRLIISKAEGNPFYIQELLHALIGQGVLVQGSHGHWRETRPVTSLDLPGSLQTTLLARIDRLSIQEKEVLQLAAVVGMTFWRNVLEKLAGPGVTIKNALAGLQRAQLIQERNQVPYLGMEYGFTSPLVRDVVYESLLTHTRRQYHLMVAEYLEDFIDLEDSSLYDSSLAYHYRMAGDYRKELFYTLSAAEANIKVNANTEALNHYNRAIELLDLLESGDLNDDQKRICVGQRFDVLRGRRSIHYSLGNSGQGRADSREMMELARQMPDDLVFTVQALLAQPEIADPETRDQLQNQGLPLAFEALEIARKLNNKRLELEAVLALGSVLTNLKDMRWKDLEPLALQLARDLGDKRAEVSILLAIGNSYGIDDLQTSERYLQAALEIVKELDDRYTEFEVLTAFSPQYERQGDYYTQLTEYELKRLELARRMENRMIEGNAAMFCGQVQGIYLGDYLGGMAFIEDALRLWSNNISRLYPLLRLAQLNILVHDYKTAESYLEEARKVAPMNVEDLGRAGLALVTSILYNSIGEQEKLAQVPDLCRSVHQLASDNMVSRQYHLAADCETVAAFLQLGELCEDKDKRSEYFRWALDTSIAGVMIYQQLGQVQAVECTSEEILYRHSLALRANGMVEEANTYLGKAYNEMMRKHALIPEDSPFKLTYLENIDLHKDILHEYQTFIDRKAGAPRVSALLQRRRKNGENR